MLSKRTAIIFSLVFACAGSALAGSDPCAGMKGTLKAHCEKEHAAKEKKAHACDKLKGVMKEKCQKALGISEETAKKESVIPAKAAHAPAKDMKKHEEALKSDEEEITLFD